MTQMRDATLSAGKTTIAPTHPVLSSSSSSSSSSHRRQYNTPQNVSMRAILNFSYSCNDDGDATSESTSCYQFPDLSTNNLSLSLAQSQCCTVQAYDVPAMMNPKCVYRSVQINAFPSASSGVELCCHDPENGKSSFYNIDIHHEISRIQLVPLSARQKTPIPALNDFSNAMLIDRSQAAAVMLIVSHTCGLSIYSLVFTRTSDSDLFTVSESRELSESTDSCTLKGRRVTDLQVKLVITPDDGGKIPQPLSRMQPHLLIVTASTAKQQEVSPHKVDVFAYPLVDHICPVFRFSKRLAPPIPAGYRYHSELLSDVEGVKNLSFGPTRIDGSCSLAVLSKGQLQILQLPSLQGDNEQDEDDSKEATISLKSCDGIGEPTIVIPHTNTEDFVILCRPKTEEIEFNPPTITKRSVSFSLEDQEKNGSPLSELDPQGTPWREDQKPSNFFTSPKAISPASDHPFDETIGGGASGSFPFTSPDPIKPRTLTNKSPNSLSPLEGLNLLESPPSPNSASTPDRGDNVEYLAHIVVVRSDSEAHMNGKCKKKENDDASPYKIFKCALPYKLSSFNSASMIWVQSPAINKENSMYLSPSPPKQMTNSRKKIRNSKTLPLLCVSTNRAGSSELQFAVLSSNEEGLQMEFDRTYDTKQSFVKPLNNFTRNYEIRSIALEDSKYANDPDECSQLNLPDARILLYAKSDNQNTSFSKGIQDSGANSVLTEDGRVVVGFVSLPLFDNDCTQTVATDSTSASLSTSDPAMAKLEEIANSFRRFEAKMTKRMEGIEKVLSDNTSRIQQLEKAMDNLTALEI